MARFSARRLPAVLLLSAALLAAGCSGAAGTAGTAGSPGGQKVTIMARSVSGVGTVLVNARGYALYMFQPDGRRSVTCTGACAGTWPPVMVPAGGTAVAGAGVKAALLGSAPDPDGGRVVTYDGWPLYGYTGDVSPGDATGQNIDLNGGYWWVIRPSGQPLIPQP
jgi:predicted lipoprotein with Yx(FWY)xxD motif